MYNQGMDKPSATSISDIAERVPKCPPVPSRTPHPKRGESRLECELVYVEWYDSMRHGHWSHAEEMPDPKIEDLIVYSTGWVTANTPEVLRIALAIGPSADNRDGKPQKLWQQLHALDIPKRSIRRVEPLCFADVRSRTTPGDFSRSPS